MTTSMNGSNILHGVQRFYMYSNGNPPQTYAILEPYASANYVTLIDWPDAKGDQQGYMNHEDAEHTSQTRAHIHWTANFTSQTVWVLKVDTDEFVYPLTKTCRTVAQALHASRSQPTIQYHIPRWNFGSSGHKTKPNGLVIESYHMTDCETEDTKALAWAAAIDASRDKGHPHYFEMIA
jgi:hypothetical protein